MFPILVEVGWKLLDAVDEAGLEVTDAFWLYLPDAESWRLVLASPQTETDGTIALALRIGELLDNMADDERDDLSLSDIAIVPPYFLRVQDFRHRYGKTSGTSGRGAWRNGAFRSEPLIYRLDSPAPR